MEVANNARATITVVVKKPSKEALEENNTVGAKKRMLKKTKKELDANVVVDNNRTAADNFYHGMAKHNKDGSLNTKYTQEDINKKKERKGEAVVQTTTITAIKTSRSQDVGVRFAIQHSKLFVTEIDTGGGSIFGSTALQVGDRVLSINDMNFRVHADDEYASKICEKAKETVTMVVEKNDPTFEAPKGIGKKKKGTASRPTNKCGSKYRDDDDTVSTVPSCVSDWGDSDSVEDSNRNGVLSNPRQTDFKIEKYTQTTITAPKAFAKQLVGIDFRVDDRVGYVYVYKILDKSLFLDTSLEEGDWILSINDVDLRGNGPKGKPSHGRHHTAAMACMKAKESVSMVVLKDESTYFEKKFDLDGSTSNLDWLVDSARGLNVN